MAYDPSNPNKYKNEASEYCSSVNDLNSELDVALSELNLVNETLGFSSSESKGISAGGDTSVCKDVLTLNTIVSNEEIKAEIKDLQADLGHYKGAVSQAAIKLDAEEKEEYDRQQELLRKQREAEETAEE